MPNPTLSKETKAASLEMMAGLLQKMTAVADALKAIPDEGEAPIPEELSKSFQEVTSELGEVAKSFVPAAPKKDNPTKNDNPPKPDDVLKGLPKEHRELIEKAISASTAAATAAVEKLQQENADLKEETVELSKRVQSEIDQRELKDMIALAKRDCSVLPGTNPEKLGTLFKSLSAKDPEALKDLQGVLKAASAALEKSGLYAEYVPQGGDDPVDFSGRVKKRAAELQAKNPDLTDAQARIAATKAINSEDPGAYVQARRENSRPLAG